MINFIIGLIIGLFMGVFLISALILAGEDEKTYEEYLNETKEEKRYEKQDK